MNSVGSSADHPAPPLPDRPVPLWLAAGGLFLLLGFAINAAVITVWEELSFVWLDFLHPEQQQITNELSMVVLAPIASVVAALLLAPLPVFTGAIVMAFLIRVLGALPFWTVILLIPLCIFAFALQSHLSGRGPWAIDAAFVAAQIPFVLFCWVVYRALTRPSDSPERARLCRRILHVTATLIIAAIVVIAGASLIVHWKPWRPEVSWSSATTLPKVSLATEWETKEPSGFISWSPDGTKILTLSRSYSSRLMVQDPAGHVEQQREFPGLPSLFSPYFASNGKQIILAGEIKTGVAFSVVDIASGRTVFQEPLLQPNEPGLDKAELTLSRDGSVLAAVHGQMNGHPVLKRPISFYDTRTWQKLSTIELPVAPSEVGRFVLSADGGRLAFQSAGKFFVVDARTGQPITIIALPVQSATFIALSPDSSMAAVAEADTSPPYFGAKAIRIFRLTDGTQVASREAFSHGPDCSENQDDCGLNTPILWASNGRFLIFPDGYYMIRLWNPFANAGEGATIKTRYFERGIALSPDGDRLAISNGDFVSVFHIDR
jgi:WD40 repeat protein